MNNDNGENSRKIELERLKNNLVTVNNRIVELTEQSYSLRKIISKIENEIKENARSLSSS